MTPDPPGCQRHPASGRSVLVPWLLVLALAGTGCDPGTVEEGPGPGPVAEWMTEDPTGWPRIALINQIAYADAEHPSAACGFLLESGGEVFAATAKHVLTYFKSEPMDSVSFRGTLEAWRMFPKDAPGTVVVTDHLINEDPEEPLTGIPSSRDWLLFTVRKIPDGLQPLRLRTTPMRKNERVYSIGWRYPDEGPQRVHEGRFLRIDQGSLLVSIESLAGNTVPGLSGSPVIDAGGYVVGLMSKGSGKLQRLAPAGYAVQVLEARSQNDPGP